MTIVVESGIDVVTRDGTRLATDVYRPVDGCWPALVIRLPYGRQGKGISMNSFDVMRAVRAGYVVVAQDTRGRFDSGGEFEPFQNEADDGVDTINWVAMQPWCSGRVGMIGGSYMGVTQWTAAAAEGVPTALQALAPVVTPADYYDGWAYSGGAFQLGLCLWWTLHSLVPVELRRRADRGVDGAGDQLTEVLAACNEPDPLFQHLPMRGIDLFRGVAPYYEDWLDHPARDGYWQARSPLNRLRNVDVPALIIGGWFDCFLDGTFASWAALRENQGLAQGRQRLVIGPWAHGAMGGVFPERSFGESAGTDGAVDLPGLQLQWFDWHLGGKPPSFDLDRPVKIFVMGLDEWRDEADWPLPGTDYTDWYIDSDGAANTAAGDGTMSTRPPTGGRSDVFSYDPRCPVPTHGGRSFLPGGYIAANAGPRDQRQIESRDDVLCYTSAPLDSALTIIGPVRAIVYVSSSVPDTDITAKLVDMHADGRAMSVTDGIVRLRYRNSIEAESLLRPDAEYEVTVEMGSTAIVLAAGHRLRLEVSSSNFPRFGRNTNSGGVIADDTAEQVRVAVNRVHHRPDAPSRLVLPVQHR